MGWSTKEASTAGVERPRQRELEFSDLLTLVMRGRIHRCSSEPLPFEAVRAVKCLVPIKQGCFLKVVFSGGMTAPPHRLCSLNFCEKQSRNLLIAIEIFCF